MKKIAIAMLTLLLVGCAASPWDVAKKSIESGELLSKIKLDEGSRVEQYPCEVGAPGKLAFNCVVMKNEAGLAFFKFDKKLEQYNPVFVVNYKKMTGAALVESGWGAKTSQIQIRSNGDFTFAFSITGGLFYNNEATKNIYSSILSYGVEGYNSEDYIQYNHGTPTTIYIPVYLP
ncbi:hypothetical protein YWS52_14430 [Chitiniphilus shinanonensis]